MANNWRLGLGFSLITVVMWGLLPLALKEVLATMDPVTISWYRFSLSALIATLWYGLRRRTQLMGLLAPGSRHLGALAVLGLVGNYLLYIWGLDHITPSATQIIIQLAPLTLLVGSVVLFGERLSTLQWLGVAAFSLGMLLFFYPRLSRAVPTGPTYLVGVALVTGAALSWTLYGLAQKVLLARHHAQDLLLLICLAGTVLLLPLATPSRILALSPLELALLLFCGLNTIIAYGCFGLAMSYWQASRVSAIMPLAPLLTLLFAWLLSIWDLADIPSEPFGPLVVLGALLVVTGAALAALSGSRPVPDPAAD